MERTSMLKMTGVALAFGSLLLFGCGSDTSTPAPPPETTENTGKADAPRGGGQSGDPQELQGCATPQHTGVRSPRDRETTSQPVQCKCTDVEYPCGSNRDGSTFMCHKKVCGYSS